ncbi:Dipeptidase [Purpureocillium lavendulum]|uniref:Dipeptidase n=1 Tax=Purpureocillium lavendulum TaxID=1247861 RepID=A0AB34FEU2_9HYPO|nr:Dipeptidase [Purpureocillium lavendulum]
MSRLQETRSVHTRGLDDFSIYKYVIPSEALVYAIMTGNVTEVRHLARLGADISSTDSWIVYEACLHGREMMQAMMLNEALNVNPALPGQMGDTVFHFLLRTPSPRFADSKAEVIKSILVSGIQPWERDRLGNTALHILATSELQGDQDGYGIMKLLLDHKPQIPVHITSRFRAIIDAPNEHGNSPLLLAALHNNLRCLQLLLDNGACPNVKGQFNKTPLFFARSRGYVEIAELLTRYRATMD